MYDSKSGNLIGLLQAKESFSNQIINIANYNGQLEEADKYIDNLYSEYSKNISIIVSENNEKIQEINKKINELQSSISKNEIKIKNNYIKSNLDGVMTGLSVFDVGQIVMPGQDLGRIVPIDNNFEIDAYVENKDGGFVIVGKNANVKVDMFPFTKFGILNSEVIRVSKDSFDLSDLQVKSRFPQKSIESTLPGGSIVYKNLVFPINLKILSQNSDIGNYIPLTSGMTVSVEIKTGSRLLIEYFLSSLLELKHNSFKEN